MILLKGKHHHVTHNYNRCLPCKVLQNYIYISTSGCLGDLHLQLCPSFLVLPNVPSSFWDFDTIHSAFNLALLILTWLTPSCHIVHSLHISSSDGPARDMQPKVCMLQSLNSESVKTQIAHQCLKFSASLEQHGSNTLTGPDIPKERPQRGSLGQVGK